MLNAHTITILPLREGVALTREEIRRLRRAGFLLPVAGGEGEGEGSSGSGSGSGGEGAAGSGSGSSESGSSGGSGESGSGGGDSAEERVQRAERAAAAANKTARDAQKALADRDEKEAKDRGEWEKVAKDRERERDEARTENQSLQRNQTAERVARRLEFRNPADALFAGLSEIDPADEKAVEAKLKAFLTERPYLKQESPAGMAAGVGSGANGANAPVARADLLFGGDAPYGATRLHAVQRKT